MNMMERLRILIADDHELIRQGVRRLIEMETGWEVCGEAEDARSAVDLAEKLKPNVMVLDLVMPGLHGTEAIRQVKRVAPATEVLIFTGHENGNVIRELFVAGARGYVLKTDLRHHLMDAIRALGQHRAYFSRGISEIVMAEYVQGSVEEAKAEGLTSREREIMQLLTSGKTNKETAAALGISR